MQIFHKYSFITAQRVSSLFFLLLLTMYVHAQEASPLNAAIDEALTARCLEKSQTAVSIVSLPSGKTIYEYNASTPLLPASVMKLVTSAAALHYLGPEYRFKTEFLQTGRRVGSVIQGDFIIKGNGDPQLTSEQLWTIATRLKASGITEISGNLIADTSFFDANNRTPGWDHEPSQRPFDAPIGALSINLNNVGVYIRPGASVGEPLNVWLEPAPTYMRIDNSTRTVSSGRGGISVQRFDDPSGQVILQVRGKLSPGAEERQVYLNIEDPARYAIESFHAFLQQLGIRVKGSTAISTTPVGGALLYEMTSPPLSLLLKTMNTYSSNFMAEQILKTIAAEKAGKPGTHEQGLRLVAEFLQSSGIHTQGILLADGSGLSHKNQFTTRAMTDLLTTMLSRFDVGPDYLSVLRVMGAYGVASNRFKDSPAHGRVRAKTGTLNGVSTLSGYVESQSGQLFGYALFLNNNRCGYSGADRVEDRIVNSIYEIGNSLSPALVQNTSR